MELTKLEKMTKSWCCDSDEKCICIGCAKVCVSMQCMQNTLDMWIGNCTTWYVVTFNCECVMQVCL